MNGEVIVVESLDDDTDRLHPDITDSGTATENRPQPFVVGNRATENGDFHADRVPSGQTIRLLCLLRPCIIHSMSVSASP